MEMQEFKPKKFWQKPEGVTGAIFLAAIVGGIGFLIASNPGFIPALFASTISLVATLAVLGAVIYMILDPKMRNLIWYMYKSVMRTITGWFVQIDPIGILKSYTDDLKGNLSKMNKQIGQLKGQMHKLKELIVNNQREIKNNLAQASKAKQVDKKNIMILYKKMEILYRVLTKMYENSEILLEDVKDQVMVKEQEYKAIKASHSAMKSAASVISGNPDKRAMFDMAMEAIADDVSNKVGEMERFMDMSSNFMDSIDLQNGVFEEEGMKMLEKWEKEGVSILLGEEKGTLVDAANDETEVLDLNQPVKKPIRETGHTNQYDSLFD